MSVTCGLEFGGETLRLRLPDGAELLSLPEDSPLACPVAAIRASLRKPIGAPPLAEIVRAKRRSAPHLTAAVVVSDNTRPVPYRGKSGILEPVLEVLRAERVERIEILVATGTHRPLSDAELRKLLPDSVFGGDISIANHSCTDGGMLRLAGRTARGTEAWINRRYLDADLKILTGLVEPHFMAGASGGPKSICPGLAGEALTRVFHGAELLADERSASLVLDGNPCHEESMAVARMAGADFIVNVTLDGARRVTGVFSGELRAAHRAAVERLLAKAGIPIAREYDLVVTHAGFVGLNHYQAAKAAVEGVKAVRSGGTLVLAAHHTDADPVGSANYRRALELLRRLGADGFMRRILAPEWQFLPEQWEAQMWARALKKLAAPENLVYCCPQLTGSAFADAAIPGADGGAGLKGLAGRDLAEAMVQRAVERFAAAHPGAGIAVLLDGPYGVPLLEGRAPGAG